MSKKKYIYPFVVVVLIVLLVIPFTQCNHQKTKGGKGKDTNEVKKPDTNTVIISGIAPAFTADSAYGFVEKQLSFGPRNPGSKGHKKCGDYLVAQLKKYGLEVMEQKGNVTTYQGLTVELRNIIGQYNKAAVKRVLLCAHWDTRPMADQEKGKENVPVPGADDGGSGVAVLLEIARQLQSKDPGIGVDIIFFDVEDSGEAQGDYTTYCLGSQYWATNPPIANYYPQYGILLDMVGAKDARFLKEGTSVQANPVLVDRVWSVAAGLGYSNYFINKSYDGIVDDHLFINSIARIPTIDILNFDRSRSASGFGSHWHTTSDDINIIDTNTLKAVGQTVLEVIYTEGYAN